MAFLLFLALMAGNLIVTERLYGGIANTATIVNESGRLRYLSQEIAFRSAILAYEKHQDSQVLGQLLAKKEEIMEQTRQATILVVDDDEFNRKLLKLQLAADGHAVRTATSGEEALASVAEQLPDLVLLDIVMPGIDGFEVTHRLKADSRTRPIPIIMVTALDDHASRIKGLEAGAEEFLSKPVDRAELQVRVRNLIKIKAFNDFLTDHNRILEEQVEVRTAALRESKERYRRITEGLTDYLYTVHIENDRSAETSQSPACEAVTGYTAEEFAANPHLWIQIVVPEDRELVMERVHQILEGNDVSSIEHRIIRKNGETRWVSDTIILFKDVSGKLLSYDGVIKDITERKRYQAQLERQANFDELTGLPNRNLLTDRLAQALMHCRQSEKNLAVLVFNLDRFKEINDSLGHGVSDKLLREVSELLGSMSETVDTLAHTGGDGFVLLAEEGEMGDVVSLAQGILKALAQPFLIEERELFLSASIGIAMFPRDGEDGETLLKNAGAAMYRAKAAGGNGFNFYTAGMNVHSLERLNLENKLRHAIERDAFVVHYQPQVDLRTGEIVGMEALVRWQHPELGLVSPARFIPVAEESGLIVPLGEWVLRTACTQNMAWQRAGLKPISVAVNLSARQFRQPDLVEVVAGILRETELDPTHLELELTESLVMQNVEVTIATLGRLKAMGIKLSIDDFGTGYSSLSYLKRFPIHTLKIDQSFVRDITTDPDDAAIAKAIISMAHDLQLRVIAEGVETEEQKSFLQQRHCDEMQGFFFSKPVPAVDFEVLLRERRCLQMADSTAALGQRTLLLLDDEENILTSLTRLLRRDGYEILKATSAAAAFELLAEHSVGVIISDQRMPEMNGTEFLRRVKQIYPDTVRMVLSGYTDLKSVTDAINEGAVYRFLTKPWDDELLRANIQEAFQRYELAQDNQRLSDEMVSINEELNRAKRELEKRVEQKTSEVRQNVGVLQISQEMLEYLPVGVIGVGEDGLIAVANRKANELFDAGNKPPLVGSLAAERLPAAMIECLAKDGERHAYQFENGSNVIFWSHAMGASSGSEGRVLMIVPNEEGGY
ncbi:MAG: EAL domain-containing protein [Sulfuricella sp.]